MTRNEPGRTGWRGNKFGWWSDTNLATTVGSAGAAPGAGGLLIGFIASIGSIGSIDTA